MVEARALFFAACAFVLGGCGAADDPNDHLVAWWRFDERAGTIAADSSGSGNEATVRNGAWAEGRYGGALAMDGGNDGIVVVALSESLRATAREITVAAWTYRTATHNVAVLTHGYPTLFFGFHGPRFKWQIEHQSGRQSPCYADEKHEAGLNRWIHMAATYDGWVARLYVDGVEICRKWALRSALTPGRAGDIRMPDAPFTLSGYLDDSNTIVDEITGRLDDVRIYDRALSGDEVSALASSTR